MPKIYYGIWYADGGYWQTSRYEDVVACKQSDRKIKVIKTYELTERGVLVKTL